MKERLISTKEACRMLNIERGTLYIWRNKGKIKMQKCDGQYYLTAEELQPIIDERFKTGKVHSWIDLLNRPDFKITELNRSNNYVVRDSETQ
ncbi:helix-turn-helix domain-containing protein [Sphingobacterium multivorum]|uniref:helix-turn-helix domain-containing protein n=1 Tax=Sphingobacterium multivorum TaxID=28454 RepID=UPI002FDAB199